MSDEPWDPVALRDETVEFLTVVPHGDGWRGPTPDWFGDVMFGGFTLAQAVQAVTRTAPPATRMHSLHAHFLAVVWAGTPLDYEVTSVRDGRAFSVRSLRAKQDGRPVFAMTASFTDDTDGAEYAGRLTEPAAPPDSVEIEYGEGPWERAFLGPTDPDADGVMASTHRMWMRPAAPFTDDPHLQAALLAFVSDMTGAGARPLDLEGDMGGIISLDHAVWFHRPPSLADWVLYDLHSTINTGGRGFLRGGIYDLTGDLMASVAQETLLRS